MVYYQHYTDIKSLKNQVALINDKIQCIVTNNNNFKDNISFGNAQKPEIWDYSDNIDTMKFLLGL